MEHIKNLYKGIYALFRNEISHNSYKLTPLEADIALSSIGYVLELIESNWIKVIFIL